MRKATARQILVFAGVTPEFENPIKRVVTFLFLESQMAYISQRGAYWRAEVRRRGYKPVYRSFDTKQLAQKWAREIETQMDARSYVDRSEGERTTLGEGLARYLKEVVPTKTSPRQEEGRVKRWEKHPLSSCSYYLSAIATAWRGCQPPPSALNAATAARADSVCACARALEVCSSVSSACSTSIKLAAPFRYATIEDSCARPSDVSPWPSTVACSSRLINAEKAFSTSSVARRTA